MHFESRKFELQLQAPFDEQDDEVVPTPHPQAVLFCFVLFCFVLFCFVLFAFNFICHWKEREGKKERRKEGNKERKERKERKREKREKNHKPEQFTPKYPFEHESQYSPENPCLQGQEEEEDVPETVPVAEHA